MADNNPPPDSNISAAADTDIAAASSTSRTEAPRLNIIVPILQGQQPQQGIAVTQQIIALQQQILAVQQQILAETPADSRRDPADSRPGIGLEDSSTKCRDSSVNSLNQDNLQPLRDVQTGVTIPNCPGTFGETAVLSEAVADQILQALEISLGPEATIAQKRVAIWRALV